MKYQTDSVNLTTEGNRDLKRNNVTISLTGFRVVGDTIYSSILHEAPQEGQTLKDDVEFQLLITDAPKGVSDAVEAIQEALAAHYLATVYPDAVPVEILNL